MCLCAVGCGARFGRTDSRIVNDVEFIHDLWPVDCHNGFGWLPFCFRLSNESNTGGANAVDSFRRTTDKMSMSRDSPHSSSINHCNFQSFCRKIYFVLRKNPLEICSIRSRGWRMPCQNNIKLIKNYFEKHENLTNVMSCWVVCCCRRN